MKTLSRRLGAGLPRTVLALGLVSLLADVSSEMVYPLLPVLLTAGLGASALALGLVEGVAETTAAVVKLLSGRWSDRLRRRKPLVVAGYGLAAAARPLIAFVASWPGVLVLRFVDRVGKGLRGAPRDALIADATPLPRRATAFGLHRAMDHAGAMIGPLLGAALVGWLGLSLPQVFLLTLVPGAATVVVLLLAVREEPREVTPSHGPLAVTGLAELPGSLRRLLLAILVFTLGNSTDAFLLLRLTETGAGVAGAALLWSAHHAVKMAGAAWGGRLGDRFSRRTVVLLGWGIYALCYGAFALSAEAAVLAPVFLLYGLALGLAEPAEKAWIADLAPQQGRGGAFGAYHATVGVAALPASLAGGALWLSVGPAATFAAGALLAALGAAMVLGVPAGPLRSTPAGR
ncbi:MAG TPA: MFS transporter [Thermoanaerobaculia bacterium]|nr:MFS transporter [Thermoanaerobaculia bacterium]